MPIRWSRAVPHRRMSVKNAGQTLNPYRSKQYEVGLKSDIGEMNRSAALFRLERPFAYLDTDSVYKEQVTRLTTALVNRCGNVWQGLNNFTGNVTFHSTRN